MGIPIYIDTGMESLYKSKLVPPTYAEGSMGCVPGCCSTQSKRGFACLLQATQPHFGSTAETSASSVSKQKKHSTEARSDAEKVARDSPISSIADS